MTCDPRTIRCQTVFSLSLSLTLIAVWTVYRLPVSILPILVFLQWMPLILKSEPLSLLGRPWVMAAGGLLLLGILAGIVRLSLGA